MEAAAIQNVARGKRRMEASKVLAAGFAKSPKNTHAQCSLVGEEM
jgi:hypothetical protein